MIAHVVACDPLVVVLGIIAAGAVAVVLTLLVGEFRRERRRKAEQVRERVWWGQGR